MCGEFPFASFLDHGEIRALQLHDDCIQALELQRVLHEIVDLANVRQALQAEQNFILHFEHGFRFIRLFYFERHVPLILDIKCLIDNTCVQEHLLNEPSPNLRGFLKRMLASASHCDAIYIFNKKPSFP